MGDDLDIGAGGVVAVDTETLRQVATRLDGIGRRLDEASSQVNRAHRVLVGNLSRPGAAPIGALTTASASLDEQAQLCRDEATATRLMADAYELADLRSRQEMLGDTDPQAALGMQDRIDALLASDPRLAAMADDMIQDWEGSRFEGLRSQYWDFFLSRVAPGGSAIGLMMTVGASLLAGAAAGVIPRGTALRGPIPPVVVKETARTTPVGAPKNTAEMLKRIPNGTGAQVRVETYRFADGTRQHKVYIDGTQSFISRDDPWDMGSNWDGYDRQNFASLEATKQALELAGVRPGEQLDIVGYSQGGLIGTYLAIDDTYDVREVVLAGSPTVPELREDQTLVQLAHTADPVASLAGGGWPGGTGSEDSLVARREGDSGSFINEDAPIVPHLMESYLQTAEMLDASEDPRALAVQERQAHFDEAVEVTSVDFTATRP